MGWAGEPAGPGAQERNMSFFRDESGQDIVEYALLMAFVGLAGAAAINALGSDVNTLWANINSRMTSTDAGPLDPQQ